MTLDDAIKHAEKIMKVNEKECNEYPDFAEYVSNCKKCAEDHRQLAEWLKELQQYRELFDSPEEAAYVLNMSMV